MHVHFDSIFGTLFWQVLPNATNVENNFLAIAILGNHMNKMHMHFDSIFGTLFWQLQPMWEIISLQVKPWEPEE